MITGISKRDYNDIYFIAYKFSILVFNLYSTRINNIYNCKLYINNFDNQIHGTREFNIVSLHLNAIIMDVYNQCLEIDYINCLTLEEFKAVLLEITKQQSMKTIFHELFHSIQDMSVYTFDDAQNKEELNSKKLLMERANEARALLYIYNNSDLIEKELDLIDVKGMVIDQDLNIDEMLSMANQYYKPYKNLSTYMDYCLGAFFRMYNIDYFKEFENIEIIVNDNYYCNLRLYNEYNTGNVDLVNNLLASLNDGSKISLAVHNFSSPNIAYIEIEVNNEPKDILTQQTPLLKYYTAKGDLYL